MEYARRRGGDDKAQETAKLVREAGKLMERAAAALGERLPKGTTILETSNGEVRMSADFQRLMRRLQLQGLKEGSH